MHYLKNILFALLFLQLFTSAAFSKQDNVKVGDLTIIISSYDGYSELWDPFFKQLFQNWESLNTHNSHVQIVLVSNTKQYPNERVISALSDVDKGWSGNMRDALSQVKTKYVLYLQEDYFIYHQINEERIKEIVHVMKVNDIAYTELYIEQSAAKLPSNPKLANSVVKPKEAEYIETLYKQVSGKRKCLIGCCIKMKIHGNSKLVGMTAQKVLCRNSGACLPTPQFST